MDLNWLGIIAAAVANIIVGAVWYSPQVFGTAWMCHAKADVDKCKDAGARYAGAFIIALVTAAVLSVAISHMGNHTFLQGAKIGFLMWLGFVAPTQASGVIWESKCWSLFLIHTGCMLVTLILMGGILGAMS